MNKSFCNSCLKLAPATQVERDGKIYLQKECPECGTTETMISSDAARYNDKRSLDPGYDYHGCEVNCDVCRHGRKLRFAFVDVTNFCNMNCPICCANVPGMGFKFNPPLEYFDGVFRRLAEYTPKPTICLFGGEPTVRDDLFEIIDLARSHGLRPRVFTNGIRLADEEYCRKLLKSRAHILFSYDGDNPETYRTLRGSEKYMALKQKAIENVGKMWHLRRGRKMTMISCIARGLNAEQIPELLRFCHDRRDYVNCLYFMPLAHMWDREKWDYSPERLTTEGCEALVDEAFPDHKIEFLPLGFVAQFSVVRKYIGREPLPYGAAHPNCESMYYLVSDGEKWVPVIHLLKVRLIDFGRGLMELEKRLIEKEKRWEKSFTGRALNVVRLRAPVLRLTGLARILFYFMRRLRLRRLFKGWGPAKLFHALMVPAELVVGRKALKVLERHTHVQGLLQVIILPLEDDYVIETERLERCPTVHAYFEPETGEARFVPVCAWRRHNRTILRDVLTHYPECAGELDPVGDAASPQSAAEGTAAEG